LGKLFGRFPELLPEIAEITHELLEREKEKTQVYVDGVIDSECGYLFTNDYSYLIKRSKVINVSCSKKEVIVPKGGGIAWFTLAVYPGDEKSDWLVLCNCSEECEGYSAKVDWAFSCEEESGRIVVWAVWFNQE